MFEGCPSWATTPSTFRADLAVGRLGTPASTSGSDFITTVNNAFELEI